MIDIDNGPLVFAIIIFFVFLIPILYGAFVVDAHWKKHQAEAGDDDVFN